MRSTVADRLRVNASDADCVPAEADLFRSVADALDRLNDHDDQQ